LEANIVIRLLCYFVERDQNSLDIFSDSRAKEALETGSAMSVVVAEDRSMCVQPHQLVRTAWVDIDLCLRLRVDHIVESQFDVIG
jgi:hypothetical protein